MKIASVTVNNHRHAFQVATAAGTLLFPYAKAEPSPAPTNPVVDVYVDTELGIEGFTYRLQSGEEGSVHVEQVLEYNRDPTYMRDLVLYQLTLEAEKRVARSPLTRSEMIRRLGTAPAQFYRLLTPPTTASPWMPCSRCCRCWTARWRWW